ncbi:histidinol-phosphate transaminase [Mesonia aquimarina]|uniref:histidinol-phosphate transaminase n=1 Tax=Mesonia aquimarina TaxID=1504967 RepID=UPI000EF5E6C9|nr:histidinol-phosphate transaminase [Mesonia aquimarina]
MSSINLQQLVRKNIQELTPYSAARNEYQSTSNSTLFLDANENPFETAFNRYPDPNQTKLKNKLSRLKGVCTDQILLGNGSDELLDLIIRAFCEPQQDNLIITPPTYGMYEVLARINNVFVKEVPLNSSFKLKTEKIIQAATHQTKLTILCSPNNPTGNTLAKDDIEILLQQQKGLLIIDEAYIDFSDKESWLTKLNDFPNLIIIQTLSKAYGMAGIRLGIAYASPQIIAVLQKIKPPYNVNSLTQKKAQKKIIAQHKLKKEIYLLTTEKQQMIDRLKAISFVDHIYPSDTNFLLVRVDNAVLRYQQLIKYGIVVRDRSKEKHCNNCLRVSIGTPKENAYLLSILKNLQEQL